MVSAALPTRLLLRWDLTVRVGLAVLVPVAVQLWLTGGVTGTAAVAAFVAAIVSVSSLGPEFTRPEWVAVAAVGTPVALVVGTVVGPSATGGILLVFLVYVAQGAMTQAGLISQLAWFPVATVGLAASVLATGTAEIAQVAVAATAGAIWAVLLMVLVPRVLRAPRIPLPPAALAVDVDRLIRMVRRPTLRDWVFPVVLGVLASGLLLVASALTDGFKPYWAVFALVSVLSPTAAATRRSTWETVGSTLLGIFVTAVLLASGLRPGLLFALVVVLALVGAVLTLRNGLVSKVLSTPLPVVIAAASLGPAGGLALSMRLFEYILGAGVGFVAAFGGEWLSQRLERDRPADQSDLAG